ncbi:MAG: winged helix-turn-helix domain-containing protein [Natronomonas sp.]
MTAAETISDLPPSAKLVYYVLRKEGSMTQREIAAETRLAVRTVRSALTTLEDREIVDQSLYVPDARKNVYTLTQAPASATNDDD